MGRCRGVLVTLTVVVVVGEEPFHDRCRTPECHWCHVHHLRHQPSAAGSVDAGHSIPGNSTRSQLSNRVEGELGVVYCMLHALDIGSYVVWCTSDQLRLEGEPVDGDLRSVGVLVVFFHHHMSRTKPSDLDQVRLPCVTPEPNTLTQAVLGTRSLVLHLESSSESTISISVQKGLLGTVTLVEHVLKGCVATK